MDHGVTIAESNAGYRAAVEYLHCVGITVLGKASQWNTAPKSINVGKECDEHASNVTMDNATMNACEKEDQQSTALKMLVEHGEKDNVHFNSVTSASIVEKQLAEELTVFRSVRAKCVEKTHRSNSVLMNVLRGRPVTASVLQQEVTSRADEKIGPDEQHVNMEQESFQSKRVSNV